MSPESVFGSSTPLLIVFRHITAHLIKSMFTLYIVHLQLIPECDWQGQSQFGTLLTWRQEVCLEVQHHY